MLFAVGLQYFQMAQVNNRAKKTGQNLPSQQQTMQKLLPIIFFYFYVIIPAAVVLYMVSSTIIRIVTQYVMFKTGVSDPSKHDKKEVEKEIPGKKGEKGAKAPEPSTLKPANPQNRSKAKRNRKAR